MDASPAWQIRRYHEETKHHFHRYARSLGYLDWASQPNPFRFYEGATSLLLPLLKKDPEGSHLDLYDRSRNAFWDFQLESVGAFLELSLGLSAWKSIPEGNRWALRMNPSSGNLHPTEAHLILPQMEVTKRVGGPPELDRPSDGGIYHYNPYGHALELRAVLPSAYWERIRGHFLSPGFLIGLTSIAWREAWKYGERALRYCYHDAGHALGALSFAGNLLGWKVTVLTAPSEFDIATLLGLEGMTWPEGEQEFPEWLAFVSPSSQKAIPRGIPSDLLRAFSTLSFKGTPNRLSQDHTDWPIISEALHAGRKPRTPEGSIRYPDHALLRQPLSRLPAAQLIRQRRSAVAFDGLTSITTAQFLAILDKTLPRNGFAPFDAEAGDPAVHLMIFVHRVIGLEAGLYWFLRQEDDFNDLKRSLRREFSWERVEGPLPLYRLLSGSFQEKAAELSCLQPIAAQGAFSLAMVARFASEIEKNPWLYPALFWETGMIGQVLYLEAEAQGVRGTGIGCFFDDAVHDLLGIKNNAYQSLYHFTVGGAVEDKRLITENAYGHLPQDRR